SSGVAYSPEIHLRAGPSVLDGLLPGSRGLPERCCRIPPVPGSTPRAIPRLPRSRPLLLSFAQERLWFLDRLLPAGPVYNVTAVCPRVRGRLDEAALERALAAFVARHEALRTRFPARDGRPVQEIDPPGPLPLPRADLSSLPARVRRAEALCRGQGL